MSHHQEERAVSPEQGTVSETRDRTIARLDENEVKIRMLDTFDLFVHKGFEVHFVGIETRGAIAYRIELETDGHGPTDIRELTAIADQNRLDVYVDKLRGGALGVVAFPRV